MYSYSTEKPGLFTEEGQRLFLKIRDRANVLLKTAGSFRMQEVLTHCAGSSWQMLACVDRMVELGEIVEVTPANKCAGQFRIFTRYENF